MAIGREGSQEPVPSLRDQDVSRQATLEPVPPVSTWIRTPDKAPLPPARFDSITPLPPPRPAELAPTAPSGAGYDRWTAVYDISAHTVYLPDGRKLEAHSGLGDRLDDPRFVSERDRGSTPPGAYELTLRESLFHGVQALRLTPVGDGDVFGRSGLLAHPYMLGPSGDSNGCVSFKDYDAFLLAYQNGQVKRLIVVAQRAQEVALRGAAEKSAARSRQLTGSTPRRKRRTSALSASRRRLCATPPSRPRYGGPTRVPCPARPAPPWRNARRRRSRRRSSCRTGRVRG